jgi:hypothetical protein
VVFDDRGHFTEPHTGHEIGLGTISVRNYLRGIGAPMLLEPKLRPAMVATHGPQGRFGAVLFIEKEGFMPLLKATQLAERHDIAVMSTKGISNTSARMLIDEMCGEANIPLLVLHDFDKSGFSILGTLKRDTRRYAFGNSIKVVDLGLRLADVRSLGLEAERAYDRGKRNQRTINLRLNGATEEEIKFLLERRVELNALPSDQLAAFIERKLQHHGVKKIVPGKKDLAVAYKLFVRGKRIEEIVKKEIAKKDGADVTVPADLERRVRAMLKSNRAVRWNAVVAHIAKAAPAKKTTRA